MLTTYQKGEVKNAFSTIGSLQPNALISGWHLRDGSTPSGGYNPKADNMQQIRDFAGYFAKYPFASG